MPLKPNKFTEINFKIKKTQFYKVELNWKKLPPCKLEFKYSKEGKSCMNIFVSYKHKGPNNVNCDKKWIN